MPRTQYKPKTKPFNHQKEVHRISKDAPYFAFFFEQGTGKSKSAIDTAGHLFVNDKIDAMLITAWPNGVHYNWIDEEIPAHLPDSIPREVAYWKAQPRKAERLAVESILNPVDPDNRELKIFAMNSESTVTKKGKAALLAFLRTHRCIWIVDESTHISTHDALCTKTALSMRALAPYRRILTGTPVLEGPMKLYSQMAFLHEGILGFSNYYAFRARYAVMTETATPETQWLPEDKQKKYKTVVAFKNTEELSKKIEKYSYRVLKKDCLDLPDKLYERAPVELSKEQERAYRTMADELRVEFENGEELTVLQTVTKLVKLQQILSGFIKNEEGEVIVLPGPNPRLKRLVQWSEMMNPHDNKGIIWCKFRQDIEFIKEALHDKYGEGCLVEYHGGIDKEVRRKNIRRFQHDEGVRWFLATRAGAVGLTLTAASAAAYYSHEHSMLVRAQSEDRPHRIGQTKNVTYTDFESRGVPVGVSIDSKILYAYQKKQSLSDLILNDPPKNWI